MSARKLGSKNLLASAWEAHHRGLTRREWIAEIGYNERTARRLLARRAAAGDDVPTFTGARQALRGHAPDYDLTHVAAPGFLVKGTSTLYKRGEPEPKLQWVKTRQDDAAVAAALAEAAKGMAETLPRLEPIAPPQHTSDDLLTCYVVTDHHLGALAWHEETGADWDLKIAEKLMRDWFGAAVAATPNSGRAVLAQLGDFLHWDGLEAVTPTSKHLLDADGRYQKVVRVAIRVLRHVIDLLLAKHKSVQVICAEGNHDIASSVWLREGLAAIYEDEPRIVIERSPSPYYCVEHGQTSLFFHHGHHRKPANVAEVFAAQFRQVFGRTKYSYAHMGHLHHVDTKEGNLMIVEQHRTLAAADAYSHRLGFRTGRDAKAITYHRAYGEVSRVVISPDMVRGLDP